jgi:phosphoribosylaminoimidazole-succinocarboxamide synthase
LKGEKEMTNNVIKETNFSGLGPVRRGKVRDIYEVDGNLLIVASDRMSAFDVVMDEPFPDKGCNLNSISEFWFKKLEFLINNHIISTNPEDYPDVCRPYREKLKGRSMYVKKVDPLKVECIVRGYVSGSGWKEYLKKGTICDISLPKGLVKSQKLPQPIFTPSTKAEQGDHDENISFERAAEIIGLELALKVRTISLAIYKAGSLYAEKRGIIIADTKFEFGIDENGKLLLIDEVLTPDSSRFWPVDQYKPGGPQPSFDKQYLRDYLENLAIGGRWNKQAPPPKIPQEIIDNTVSRYLEAKRRLLTIQEC